MLALTSTDKIISYCIIPSPLGLIGLASTSKGLCKLQIDITSESVFIDELKIVFKIDTVINEYSSLPGKQIKLYFSGKLKQFKLPLDLRQGTTFQKLVWRKLPTIPYGHTRSYEWVAHSIDHPNACRAIGNANGQNPLPIVIPCHRVVRKNGDLGGYTGGFRIKQFLLDLERKHAHI